MDVWQKKKKGEWKVLLEVSGVAPGGRRRDSSN